MIGGQGEQPLMRIVRNSIVFLSLAAFFCAACPPDSYATAPTGAKKSAAPATAKQKAIKPRKTGRKKAISRGAGTSGGRYAALVVDANTGHVLYERNAGDIRYPASLTKMMTLYLAFDALKKGKLSLDQSLSVSAKAAGQPQTNISLDAGDSLPLRVAIESVVVRSANDSAMVLAEALGGTEWNFALMMTKKARELGMKNTVFRNPNGLPDNQQHTTAYDMARLAIALRRDFPEYYHYFKKQSFTYNGVTYPGHNRVLDRFPGADGVKTGYIRASGFNLVTSVKRDGYNVVAVVMGGASAASRDDQMVSLLSQTFARLEDKRNGLAKKSDADQQDDQIVSQAPPAADSEAQLSEAQGSR